MDRSSILLQTPVFADLTRDDVAELVPNLREHRYARGESLWLEGDPADDLFILVDGQLRSYRLSPDGAEVILRIDEGLRIVGHVGLFHSSRRRQVSTDAMRPTRCLAVRRDPLVMFLSRHPQAMVRMFEQLTAVAVQAASSFSGVAFDDVRSRVASALLSLADEFGETTNEGEVRIRLNLTQSTLAALVAASRENVNRALVPLADAGVVSHRHGHFHVADLAALRRIAGSMTV